MKSRSDSPRFPAEGWLYLGPFALWWALPTSDYYDPSDFLPVVSAPLVLPLSADTGLPARTHRISHVHRVALIACRALRPRRSPRLLAHNGAEDSAFGEYEPLGLLSSLRNEAQSLRPEGLRPTISLSTLDRCRCRQRPKTRYGVRWLNTSPVALSATSHSAPRGAPYFGAKWPLISVQSGHPFRSKVATHFGLKVATI